MCGVRSHCPRPPINTDPPVPRGTVCCRESRGSNDVEDTSGDSVPTVRIRKCPYHFFPCLTNGRPPRHRRPLFFGLRSLRWSVLKDRETADRRAPNEPDGNRLRSQDHPARLEYGRDATRQHQGSRFHHVNQRGPWENLPPILEKRGRSGQDQPNQFFTLGLTTTQTLSPFFDKGRCILPKTPLPNPTGPYQTHKKSFVTTHGVFLCAGFSGLFLVYFLDRVGYKGGPTFRDLVHPGKVSHKKTQKKKTPFFFQRIANRVPQKQANKYDWPNLGYTIIR